MFKMNKSRITKIFILMIFFLMILTTYTCAKDKVVLNHGVGIGFSTIDPGISGGLGITGYVVLHNLYDTLVYPTTEAGQVVKPWIAKSWDISEEIDKYTFYLREGIKFHDGSEVTAEDVAFSMERLLTIEKGMDTKFKDLIKPGDTEVIDKYTVAFPLSKKSFSFLAKLVDLKIVNKDLLLQNLKPGTYGELGDYGQAYLETHDAGSGPYKIGVIKYAESVELIKFEDYWRGWEEGSIDEVRIHIIPEAVTLVTALKKGILDMVDQSLNPRTYKELKKEPGIIVDEGIAVNEWVLILNNSRPPFDDIYVRKAVAYSIDYDAITKTILKGVPAIGPVPINLPGHSKDVVVYNHDLEKAKEMLKKSKYSAEELAAFRPIYKCIVPSARLEPMALSIIASLEEIGLKAVVENISWPDLCWLVQQEDPNVDMIGTYANADVPDQTLFLEWYTPLEWGAASPFALIRYENPEVSELLEIKTADLEEQLARYAKAQKIISEDCPVVFLANSGHFLAFRDYVKGYTYPSGAGVWDQRFDTLRIEK